jgi:acetyl-CoA/propionyl-CoA carboxylase biotin carboxyl carrier protein
VVDDALRTRIAESALAIAREVGYVNAGTLEFLVDDQGSFYFMEMNTRLQVEHPVTELCGGLDLVRLQLLVAMGEPVELAPEPRGHAIECRINAEDPFRDFLPGPGLVTRLRPPTGPFVRLDSGVTEGRSVAGDYDSLFAKLVVWGETREIARRRMLRALDEFEVEGIPTTIPFHRWVLETPEFRDATADTRWVERALEAGAMTPSVKQEATPSAQAKTQPPLRLTVEVEGHRVPVRVWGDARRPPPAPPPSSMGHGGHMAGIVAAPMQGTILDVKVEVGQSIQPGDVVAILEAMKMENHIAATQEGTVSEISVTKGDVVESGQPLIVVE